MTNVLLLLLAASQSVVSSPNLATGYIVCTYVHKNTVDQTIYHHESVTIRSQICPTPEEIIRPHNPTCSVDATGGSQQGGDLP